MPNYKMVVLTNPREGREEEYNDWYQNVHLNQVVAVNGFTRARRYRMTNALADHDAFGYLAIYDIETPDIASVLAELDRLRGTEHLTLSDALAPEAYAVIYEEFGPEVTPTDTP